MDESWRWDEKGGVEEGEGEGRKERSGGREGKENLAFEFCQLESSE